MIRNLDAVLGELEHFAVLEDLDIFLIHSEALCHFLMEAEHTVFAVNGHEELRLDKSVEHHELISVCVA